MALPGLGLPGLGITSQAPTTTSTSFDAPPITHELASNSEWRFEVALGSNITVKLISGQAELFGTELAINHEYTFSGAKAAIFTYHGCRLEAKGQCEEYTAEETPMTEYANLHFALEEIRNSQPHGPRVMVVGPNNSGKTSLVKILAGYAVRMGRSPVVVNTDPAEGMLSLPGSLSATVMSTLMDIEEGWGSSPASGPSQTPVKLPLVYWLGLGSPEEDTKIFKPVCSRLALAVTGRLDEDVEVKRSGIIVDTSGISSAGKNSYEVLSHTASEFNINIIITLGSERLQADLSRRFQPPNITVLKLSKSGGCVDRDSAFMAAVRQRQIREYFFGNSSRILSPHTQTIDYNLLTIYKLADASDALDKSFLPGGGDDEDEQGDSKGKTGELVHVGITPQMMHSVFAIVYATPADKPEVVRDASVMGFVYVAGVDEKNKRLRLLAPLTGRLGERPFLWGRFPEATMNLI